MNRKHTPLSGCALHRYLTAVGLNDVLDNGKTQAGAAEFAAAGLVHPVKPFKQTRDVDGGNAHALVCYADDHIVILLSGINPDAAFFRAVFNGIFNQIDQGLLKKRGVYPGC